MATVRVANEYWSNGLDSYRSIAILLSYSTSSTDAATTVTLDSLAVENPPGDLRSGFYCQMRIDGALVERVYFEGYQGIVGKSRTYTRTTSDQTVNVELVVEGPRTNTSGSNTATIPHLATYAVSYNANGGSGAPSSQTKYYGNDMTLSTVKPTRANYVFTSWNTKPDGSGTTYNPGATYAGNAALTLYAQWHEPYYITYDANGGSGAPSRQLHVYNTVSTLSSIRPTRDGYKFEIWNTEPHGWGDISLVPGGSYGWNSDLHLYAIWRSIPAIESMTCFRCDREGNQADEGEYGYVGVVWSCDNSNDVDAGELGGTITPQSGGSASAITFSGITSGGGGIAYAIIPNLDTDMQYTISVRAENWVDRSIADTRNAIITRAFFTMDCKAGGNGIGIGCAAPASGMEVNYPAVFDQTVNFRDQMTLVGGTSTGQLKLKTSAIDRDGGNPSSAVYPNDADLVLVDKDGERIGLVRCIQATDGKVGLQLCSINENSGGAEVANGIYLYAAKDGTKTYGVDSPENFRAAIGAAAVSHGHSYLPLSGGTLTGDVLISKNGSPFFAVRDTGFNLTQSNNGTSSTRYPAFYIQDAAGRISSRFEDVVEADGANGFYIYARQYDTSGNNTQQKGIKYRIAKNGTGTWTVSDGGSFRSAIGADAAGARRPPNAWTQLAYWEGGGTISWNWGSYNEYLIVILHDSNYLGTAVIQRDWLQTYYREVYTGGGINTIGGQTGRLACMRISRTNAYLPVVSIDCTNSYASSCAASIYGRG